MQNTTPDPVSVLTRLDRCPSLCRRVSVEIDAELRKANIELGRVDTKSSMLLATAGVLLGGGLVVLADTTRLHGLAASVAWTSVGVVALAVERLAAACQPRLGGDFGFMHWSGRPTDPSGMNLLAELAEIDPTHQLQRRARELDTVSRVLRAKYRSVRTAVWLLMAGLGGAAAAAVLTVWH